MEAERSASYTARSSWWFRVWLLLMVSPYNRRIVERAAMTAADSREVESANDRYAIEHPHGNWHVAPKETAASCPNCHGTGRTRFGVCAYCEGTGRGK